MKKKYLSILFVLLCLHSSLRAQLCDQVFSLGSDTTLHCHETFQIAAPAGFDTYVWNTGSTQSQIQVAQSGNYFCQAIKYGTNVVQNGDFSLGNNHFTSGYIPGTGGQWGLLTHEGQFTIASNSSSAHNNFVSCLDHTTNTPNGQMMIINGSSTINVNVWQQTIAVTPNTDYDFSFWGMTVVNENPGQLKFTINNAQVGTTLNLPAATCQWQQFSSTWNSGNNTSAVITITNLNTSPSGNDFAIDDITFRPICKYLDDIQVTIPPKIQFTVSNDVLICPGETASISAQSATALSYNWSPGQLTGSTIQISPTVGTKVSVTATDANNCISETKYVQVSISPLPQLSVSGNTLLCFGANTELFAESDISNTVFSWDNIQVSLIQDTLLVLVGTSPNGCQTQIDIPIQVLEQLEISIAGTEFLCEGQDGQLEVNANLPNLDFNWTPMMMNGNSILIDHSNLGWVYVSATHPSCGTVVDSILIQESAPPNLFLSPDLVVCPSSQVQLSASSDQAGTSFFWNGGSTSSPNLTTNIQQTTYFVVYAELNGCRSANDTLFVTMNPFCDLDVPNVFTPNGDGSNDYFHLISYAGITEFSCRIFNRWGTEIQHFTQPSFQWDGNDAEGQKVNDGVYFYMIEAQYSSSEKQIKHGFVHKIN